MKRTSVLSVEERPAKGELKKHNVELGKRYVFVDSKNATGGKLYIVARVVKNVKRKYEPASARTHTVDSVMLFMGTEEGLTGLKAEVQLGSKTYEVESPSSVYIPAGQKHTYRILGGSGTYMKVVLAPGGDYNAVTS